MQGLAGLLAPGTAVEVPYVGTCQIRNVIEPRMHHSNWSMQVDISFPGSYSQMTIGLYTFGSCLLKDTETVQLPDPTYEDENDTLFPAEHREAWVRVLDGVEAELIARGYRVGSADDCDFYLIEDYMPSEGVSALVLNPEALTEEIVAACQRIAKSESRWNMWVRLGFEFTDKLSKGHQESVLIRPDRIVLDLDPLRLAQEYGDRLPYVYAEGGSLSL
jgi:hypothetical protein